MEVRDSGKVANLLFNLVVGRTRAGEGRARGARESSGEQTLAPNEKMPDEKKNKIISLALCNTVCD